MSNTNYGYSYTILSKRHQISRAGKRQRIPPVGPLTAGCAFAFPPYKMLKSDTEGHAFFRNWYNKPLRLALLALAMFQLAFLGQPARAGEVDLPEPLDAAAFEMPNRHAVELGRLLFFDPILSGNKNIACATCHHPRFGTSDGLSLGIGEGGVGLGPERRLSTGDNRPERRIGRNAPALFNLGAAEFVSLFHDGRLEATSMRASGVRTPLEEDMVHGFDSILSAQAMFPVLSSDEMAGHYSENDVSTAVRQGLLSDAGGAWDIIAERIQAIPEYVARFQKAYSTINQAEDIDFTDIANAIAAFVAFEFRADNSPFDQYLKGEAELEPAALQGMELFYGKAACNRCHSGVFQTDHAFHAIAMPQLGPGKTARFETHQRDIGRMRVTGRIEDMYKFRTSSLRNIALTSPYGHCGAYATLEAVVRHHLDPVASLKNYDRSQVVLPEFPEASDWWVMDSPDETAVIAAANTLRPLTLSDDEIEQLLAFLNALTDPISQTGRLGPPEQVPSGLPLD